MDTSLNKLAEDVEIEGTLTFNGSLEFDGKLKGDIVSQGSLIIGKKGSVEGDISTDSLVVFGKAGGKIKTSSRCELKSSGTISGDLNASLFSMDEGAQFDGQLAISPKK